MKKELRTDGKRGGAPIAVEAREQGQAAKAPARPIRSYGDLRALQPAHLAVFSQAVRAGTFSETAKVLGLTQSAVSQTIERLEAQLGLTLFDRTSRPAELTSQGREVFKLAVGLLEEAERFLEAHPDVHAVLLSSDMKTALVSDAIKDRVRVTDPAIVVKIIKH